MASALMLALPDDSERGLLENIKRQQWEFSQYTATQPLGRDDAVSFRQALNGAGF